MSQENVEIIRRAYEAYVRGDLDGLVRDWAPDCEYVPTGALPGGAHPVRGPKEYTRFIGWLTEEFKESRAEAKSIRDAGDQVVVELAFTGRGKQSGVETHWTLWQVWTLSNGKIVRGRALTSEEEALEAAGLSE
jgi:ketosteroid isomerase-like protein